MTKKQKKEIIKFIEDNPIKIYWDYNTDYNDVLSQLLEQGKEQFEKELYEYNLDYFFQSERYLWEEIDRDFDIELNDEDIDELREYVIHDLNLKRLYNNLPEINCQLYAYSNYDCCNSYDDPYSTNKECYIGDIYNRISAGVKREEFANEFYNGVFGGSNFAFLFTGSVLDYLDIKEKIENAKTITIPAGTEFGFHSSFQGSCSPFEKTTRRALTLQVHGQTKYDSFDLEADPEIHYSLSDIWGGMVNATHDITDIEIN